MRNGASLWATHPRLPMKRLLLTGIAALFLATGAAHADMLPRAIAGDYCREYRYGCGSPFSNPAGAHRIATYHAIFLVGAADYLASLEFRSAASRRPGGNPVRLEQCCSLVVASFVRLNRRNSKVARG